MWYPTSKASARARVLLVVLVANMLYVFWGYVLLSRIKPWRGHGWKLWNGWTGKPKVDNIQHIRPGCYIWYQSRGRLVLRWGDCDISNWKRASKAKALLVVLVANMLYMFWGHVWLPRTKPWGGPGWKLWNEWTGRPKADNIQHVRPGCYIWYQSRGWLVLRWGIVISKIRSKHSRARALLVVLVANMLYMFWGNVWLPKTKPWGGPGWKP